MSETWVWQRTQLASTCSAERMGQSQRWWTVSKLSPDSSSYFFAQYWIWGTARPVLPVTGSRYWTGLSVAWGAWALPREAPSPWDAVEELDWVFATAARAPAPAPSSALASCTFASPVGRAACGAGCGSGAGAACASVCEAKGMCRDEAPRGTRASCG